MFLETDIEDDNPFGEEIEDSGDESDDFFNSDELEQDSRFKLSDYQDLEIMESGHNTSSACPQKHLHSFRRMEVFSENS